MNVARRRSDDLTNRVAYACAPKMADFDQKIGSLRVTRSVPGKDHFTRLATVEHIECFLSAFQGKAMRHQV